MSSFNVDLELRNITELLDQWAFPRVQWHSRTYCKGGGGVEFLFWANEQEPPPPPLAMPLYHCMPAYKITKTIVRSSNYYHFIINIIIKYIYFRYIKNNILMCGCDH